MFTTTEFARIGMVSVRMLRCFEATGLLRPGRIDPASGRACYAANQLPRLNRILALTDLGFSLPQAWAILETAVSESELRGMLRLRQAELAAQITADTARLERVEARLVTIAKEGYLPRNEVVTKEVAPIRIAELAAIADSYAAETLDRVIRPLRSALTSRLDAAGVRPDGPAMAYYDARPGYEPRPGTVTEAVTVHAAVPVRAEAGQAGDFAIAELPGAGPAATIVHHGPMEEVGTSFEALARWIDANGYTSTGLVREVFLDCPADAPEQWVTELQVPVRSSTDPRTPPARGRRRRAAALVPPGARSFARRPPDTPHRGPAGSDPRSAAGRLLRAGDPTRPGALATVQRLGTSFSGRVNSPPR
jgi:effector-binding domain-containing protein